MKIQFKKEHSKPNVLTCIRDDGSTTWVKMYPGIEAHDLGHYAVETVLGFKHAFYGMIAKGTNIEDFELPREKRPDEVLPKNLSPQALISEHLVNLIMVKAQTKGFEMDILSSLRSILREKELPYPQNLDAEKIEKIWTSFLNLNSQWDKLQIGSTMELNFTL